VTARAVILDRIHAALADLAGDGAPADSAAPRNYLRRHASTSLTDLFASRVRDYQAVVSQVPGIEVPAFIASTAVSLRLTRVVVAPEFPSGWLPAGRNLTWLADDPALAVSELDRCDAALTTAALGIAETGTIVLDAGAGQGRRALTLVPDVHLCVLRADQIVADVPDALARLDPRRPLTLISGPSATSDIELHRVEGVHGPRILHIIIAEGGNQ
jgi:L-lactate dehydrogenase complex protein LldG